MADFIIVKASGVHLEGLTEVLAEAGDNAPQMAHFLIEDTAHRRGLTLIAERPDGSIAGSVSGTVRQTPDGDQPRDDLTTLDVQDVRVTDHDDPEAVWNALFREYAKVATARGYHRVLFSAPAPVVEQLASIGWMALEAGLAWNGAGGMMDIFAAFPEDGHRLAVFPCDLERFGWEVTSPPLLAHGVAPELFARLANESLAEEGGSKARGLGELDINNVDRGLLIQGNVDLVSMLFDDLAVLDAVTEGESATFDQVDQESLDIIPLLPKRFLGQYDRRFARQFIAAALDVGGRFARHWDGPASVAEALAVRLTLLVAKAYADDVNVVLDPETGWIEQMMEELLEDTDHMYLYEDELPPSVVQESLGLNNLAFDEWFDPFTDEITSTPFADGEVFGRDDAGFDNEDGTWPV
ncbi:hypothetical protein [Leifsonia sp. Leaf264]|uniref:hypothetical protein n=1 Tax=Leifsonia sp. Leaf264 TaxID=1736314 RepID=UPI0006F9E623|nr:hypothetical protein [Leifsonia sp. Leaf264]KQO98542.1 hypothetical protein ASF30_10800 [Leifsonia sp. Leaf264]